MNDEKKLIGYIVLLLAIAFFFVSEFYKIKKMTYKDALPYEQRIDGEYTYITGKIFADDIETKNIKSGKYFFIKEQSEIFAWVPGTGLKHDTKPKLEWTETPEDPANFRPYGSGENKKFYKKSIQLTNITNQTAYILANDKKINIAIDKLDFSNESLFTFEKPDSGSLISNRFNKVAKIEYYDKRKIVSYDSENCEFEFGDQTKAGCERILLSVLKIPDNDYTLVGVAKEDEIVADGDTILIAKGDYTAFQEYYSSNDSGRGILVFLGQIILFFGLWIGFYFARETFADFKFLEGFGEIAKSLTLAFTAFVFLKTIFNLWWIIVLIPCIGYILFLKSKQKIVP